MALEDWEVVVGSQRAGGQGYVQKVRHRVDGRIGALKQLHDKDLKQTDRRGRFFTEVAALRRLDANGVPAVLEANEDGWKDDKLGLYLVMEFIEGPTLAQLVQTKPPSVDEAISATKRIVRTLAVGHRVPVHHRDLKPDNVVVRNASWSDTVLVDLGIAWHPQERTDWVTPQGTELGNRFLRLPEFAPNADHHDRRSDLAMAGGLLFYMLTGLAPRMLVNHDGRMPHEVEPSPMRPAVLRDARWAKIRSILTIVFQQRLEARFTDAEEFEKYLAQLDQAQANPGDTLDQEIAKLQELNSSVVARERAYAAPSMDATIHALYDELIAIWASVDLEAPGQNPVFKEGGATKSFYCLVRRRGQDDPAVYFEYKIEIQSGRFTASWNTEHGTPHVEYQGSVADGDGLNAAVISSVRKLAAEVIRQLNVKSKPPSTLERFLR